MNAVEVIELTPDGFWFTWAYGRRIGVVSAARGVELDVDDHPSMSFRWAIHAALKRFRGN